MMPFTRDNHSEWSRLYVNQEVFVIAPTENRPIDTNDDDAVVLRTKRATVAFVPAHENAFDAPMLTIHGDAVTDDAATVRSTVMRFPRHEIFTHDDLCELLGEFSLGGLQIGFSQRLYIDQLNEMITCALMSTAIDRMPPING
jgi:hypothetical protein